jgi:chromosome segregation ATPase
VTNITPAEHEAIVNDLMRQRDRPVSELTQARANTPHLLARVDEARAVVATVRAQCVKLQEHVAASEQEMRQLSRQLHAQEVSAQVLKALIVELFDHVRQRA